MTAVKPISHRHSSSASENLVYRRVLVRRLVGAGFDEPLRIVWKDDSGILRTMPFDGEIHSTAFIDSIVAMISPEYDFEHLRGSLGAVPASDIHLFLKELEDSGRLAPKDACNVRMLCLSGEDAAKEIVLSYE